MEALISEENDYEDGDTPQIDFVNIEPRSQAKSLAGSIKKYFGYETEE
jgi:hypothetical protein